MINTIEKIHFFSSFRKGWYYGEGEAFSDGVIKNSESIVNFLLELGFIRINALPGINGDIIITFSHNSYLFEIAIEKNNKGSLLIEDNNDVEVFESGRVNINKLKALIRKKKFRYNSLLNKVFYFLYK